MPGVLPYHGILDMRLLKREARQGTNARIACSPPTTKKEDVMSKDKDKDKDDDKHKDQKSQHKGDDKKSDKDKDKKHGDDGKKR